MQSQKELNSILESLTKCIDKEDDEEILKLADKYLALDNKDGQIQTIKLIQLIKTNDLKQSQNYYQQISKNNIKDNDYQFAEVYLLYLSEKYQEALKKIDSHPDNSTLRWKIIKSQILFKMHNYHQSYQVFVEIRNQIDKNDYGDYLINTLCYSIYIQDQQLEQKE